MPMAARLPAGSAIRPSGTTGPLAGRMRLRTWSRFTWALPARSEVLGPSGAPGSIPGRALASRIGRGDDAGGFHAGEGFSPDDHPRGDVGLGSAVRVPGGEDAAPLEVLGDAGVPVRHGLLWLLVQPGERVMFANPTEMLAFTYEGRQLRVPEV